MPESEGSVTAQCVLCPGKNKRQPDRGYACFPCVNRVLQHLGEIEDYAATLSVMKGSGAAGRRAPGFGPGSPGRDDVIVALDYRSAGGAGVHRLRDPRDESDTPIRSLLGSLHGIAQWVRGERGITYSSEPTITGEVRFLRAHLDWCAQHDWIGEVADDIADLHRQARGLSPLGERKRFIGRCRTPVGDDTCGTKLYASLDADEVHCVPCDSTWPRDRWLWLGLLLEDTG